VIEIEKGDILHEKAMRNGEYYYIFYSILGSKYAGYKHIFMLILTLKSLHPLSIIDLINGTVIDFFDCRA
jgi:hypothetical protein